MRKFTNIMDDTPIRTFIVADRVVQEASRHLERDFSGCGFDRTLEDRANTVYLHNERWRNLIRGRDGLDYMYAFMRHWLAAELQKMGYSMPHTWANGQELPQTDRVR